MKKYQHVLMDAGFDYGGSDLPMVFGSETEFGFAYGKVLNESLAYGFPAAYPERIFPLIIKMVANNTGAFVRDPESPWEREGLNHFETEEMKQIIKGAISSNIHYLPEKIKNEILRIGVSPEDFHLGQVGVFLPNGARLYIDGSHIESSTSECRDPWQVVCLEKAMERMIYEASLQAQEICGRQIFIFKNNTDGRGNSYGYHQNFSLSREFFEKLLDEDSFWGRAWLSFIVTDLIYTSGGKVGFEEGGKECDYQISQRADHIDVICGHDTMDRRPLINCRDEPLADRDKWSRLHVICGDSNMSEVATYLKVGAKALVLNMLQHQYFANEKPDEYLYLFFSDPVGSFKAVSRDLTCKEPLLFTALGKKSALEIQKKWSVILRNFYLHSYDYRGQWIIEVIEKKDDVLRWIEEDNPNLDSVLDWRIKKRMIYDLIRRYAEKGQAVAFGDKLVKAVDVTYHNIGPAGLYNKALKATELSDETDETDASHRRLPKIKRLITNTDIENAKNNPPENTRAWLRGNFMKRWLPHLVDASWEFLTFRLKIGDFEKKWRLNMEPLCGTNDKLRGLFGETENYEKFCRELLSRYLNRKNDF